MAAINAGSSAASMTGPIQDQHVGNVLYLGGWRTGPTDVRATSGLLQKLATKEATGGIPLLVAADQEGGVVQQLKDGFTTIPSARTQATWDPAEITRQATLWGGELKAAGVNLDLAPVADTVPAALGRGNGPVGRWGREYGNDPQAVTRGSVAFLKGMAAAGVGTSIKHFPGIGRIRGNTDHTTQGLTDSAMTRTDPYLAPFAAGIAAGASTVMVSSATYPKIDPDRPAMFSPTIIDGMLRTDLGWQGVVITDDVNAASVRSVPVAERATRFVAAGGDIVLTGDTPSAGTLVRAIANRAASDSAFAAQVEASVHRVLSLKQHLGLLACG
jgi:beta-N-acetylhexosaminidase